MRMDLAELKQVIDLLFEHIMETRGVTSCEIDEDLYWTIRSPGVYDMADDPEKYTLTGSLYDDWEFLSVILEPGRQPLANQLTELAPLLRYLGERLGDDLARYGG